MRKRKKEKKGGRVSIEKEHEQLPRIYPEKQRCKYCPTILSIYNSTDICGSCLLKGKKARKRKPVKPQPFI